MRLYYICSTLHPSYDTLDLPARGFSAAYSSCWSDELYVGSHFWKEVSVYDLLYVGYTLNCRSDALHCRSMNCLIRSDAHISYVWCRNCLNLTYRPSLCQFENVAAALGPDLTKPYTQPTKCVYPTYESCESDLRKVCIRITKSVHPNYKKCASDL